MFCNLLIVLPNLTDILSPRNQRTELFMFDRHHSSDLLMALTGSSGGAPGLAPDTPGAPLAARPHGPAAAPPGV